MYSRGTTAVALGAFAALAAFGIYTVHPKPVANRAWTRFERTGTTLDGWGWAAQPWTGNDRPYQKIRADINKALYAGQGPDALIADYKAKADADPKDPQAAYGWAFAVWRISTWSDEYQQKYSDFTDLPDALAAAPFPKTYNYARLRFLVQAQVRAMPQLQELGERLVKRNPKDADVKYQLIHVLRQTPSPPENREALKLAQDLVQSDPKVALYYQVLGNVYRDAYYDFGFKRADGDKAIATFQKEMEVKPPNDEERQVIEEVIKNIQSAETHNP